MTAIRLVCILILVSCVSWNGWCQTIDKLQVLSKNADLIVHIKITGHAEFFANTDMGTPLGFSSIQFDIVDLIKYDSLRLDSIIATGIDTTNTTLSDHQVGFRPIDSTKTIIYQPCLPHLSSCPDKDIPTEIGTEYIVFLKSSTLQIISTFDSADKVIIGITFGPWIYILDHGLYPFSLKLKNELSN